MGSAHMDSKIWQTEDFVAAAAEFRVRWRSALCVLGLSASNLTDLIREVDTEFEMQDPGTVLDTPRKQFCFSHRRFTAYDLTAALDSPYEILISVIDHGGGISTEHGFIDFHDSSGKAVAGFMLRHA